MLLPCINFCHVKLRYFQTLVNRLFATQTTSTMVFGVSIGWAIFVSFIIFAQVRALKKPYHSCPSSKTWACLFWRRRVVLASQLWLLAWRRSLLTSLHLAVQFAKQLHIGRWWTKKKWHAAWMSLDGTRLITTMIHPSRIQPDHRFQTQLLNVHVISLREFLSSLSNLLHHHDKFQRTPQLHHHVVINPSRLLPASTTMNLNILMASLNSWSNLAFMKSWTRTTFLNKVQTTDHSNQFNENVTDTVTLERGKWHLLISNTLFSSQQARSRHSRRSTPTIFKVRNLLLHSCN